MIPIEDQIDFIKTEYDVSMDLYEQTDSKSYITDMNMYSAILKSLKTLQSNDSLLQRKCLHCETSFTTSNSKKLFCSVKCRVAYFRAENRLKEFTEKVWGILLQKESDPKFAMGVLIVPEDYCPYAVEYKGNVYEGKTTREILTKLKKA